jgi:hypothetical protein
VVVCVVLMVVFAVSVSAQQSGTDAGSADAGSEISPRQSNPNTYEAIPLGPFLFSPAVALNWQYRDNIFFDPEDPVSDQVIMASARLQFELPINQSYLLFSYTPQYRDYKEYELDDKWSHFFDFIGGFALSHRTKLDTTYKYFQGNLETREVDPGGELYWGDRWFQKHFGAVYLSHWFTPSDGFNIEVDYTDLKHEDVDQWYDYTRLVVGAGWLHHISEIMVMNLAYRHEEFEPGPNQFFDNEFRASSSDEVTVEFRGMASPVLRTAIRAGYRQTRYNVPDEASELIPDFKGFIVNGYLNWYLGHGSSLRFDLLRQDYPSNYGLAANYVASGASVQYQYEMNRFRAQGRFRYQENSYATPDLAEGIKRKDPITTFGLGLGYRFTHFLSLWGAYLYENRDSNIDRFGYDYNVITLSLVVGY